jgi:pimeloyl-ACP methyl ester carboxylesterase
MRLEIQIGKRRMMKSITCISLSISVLFILGACTPAQAPAIDLQPCVVSNLSAECGTLSVFENRETQSGRKIDIHVAVIKAWGKDPLPDPIFYLAGGPGGSAIGDAPYAVRILKSANQNRDIVLVDQRGTGQSNRLTCPRNVDESGGLVPMDTQMIQDLGDCLKNMDADPAAYTTAWAMDDLDDVRAALDYAEINLYGESYGPTAEQVYLQRHGEHVRTMTLEGVTLLDVPIFERMPHSSQSALDLLVKRCQADVACKSAYPNFGEEITALISRLEKQPVNLPVMDPRTGRPARLDRDMLVLSIHNSLVNTESAVQLPRLLHQAYQGDWNEIAQIYANSLTDNPPTSEWQVMRLTILCHEHWARLDQVETAQFTSHAYLKYEDIRRLIELPEQVCDVVPQPSLSALYQTGNPSSVPVLLITNEADPQNPLENVAAANERYPNSLTVIAPAQGHGYSGLECRDQFVSAFIASGTTKDLDTSCLQQVPLPAFNVSE